jgi:hypothetical protein
MQARNRTAEFNLCPMPRKYALHALGAISRFNAYVRIGDRYRLVMVTARETGLQRPA